MIVDSLIAKLPPGSPVRRLEGYLAMEFVIQYMRQAPGRLVIVRSTDAPKIVIAARLRGITLPLLSDMKARVDSIMQGWASQVDDAALGTWIAAPAYKDEEDLIALATPMIAGKSKVAAILSFLDPELVRSRLLDVAKPWIDRGALPRADLAEAIAGLELEQFNAEIEEERIITLLEQTGLEVYRRPDIDPTIVLGCHAFED